MYSAPEIRSYGIGFRCASDPVAISQSNNLGTGLVSSYSNRVGIGNVSNGKLFQSVNLGNTDTYEIWTYLYDRTSGNVGGTVNSNVAELYANGSAITTEYTDMSSILGNGWWKLSGTVAGADESREYGLLVKTGKTVDVDNFSLIKQSATSPSIYTTTAYSNDKVASWPSITTDEENIGVSAVKYQICTDDGSTCESSGLWKYYDGDSWETATNTTTHTNTKLELTDTAMAALPVSSHKLSIKAIFTPDGDYPKLSSLTLGVSEDNDAPTSLKVSTNKNKKKLYDVGEKLLEFKTLNPKLYLDVKDNTTKVEYIMLSQNKNFKKATWRLYDGTIKLKFKKDGKKNLYIKLKDEAGNVSDTYKQQLRLTLPVITP